MGSHIYVLSRVRAARPGASERARFIMAQPLLVRQRGTDAMRAIHRELAHRLGALYRGLSTFGEVYVDCKKRFAEKTSKGIEPRIGATDFPLQWLLEKDHGP